MNGFNVYRNISKPKGESDYKAENLYKKLLELQTKMLMKYYFQKLLWINTTEKLT